MNRFSGMGFLFMGLLLVVAACSGSDDAADDDATTTTTTTTEAPSPAADSTVVPTAIPDIAGLSDECQGLANVMLGVIQVFGGSLEGTEELFAAGVDSLPDELEGDIETLRAAVTEFAAGIEELGVNPFLDPEAFAQLTPEQLAQFEEVATVFNDESVDAAFESIDDYGQRECDSFGLAP